MNIALYLATLGAKNREMKMEVLTTNLANASTPGYKKEALSFKQSLIAASGVITTDMSPGPVRRTGNPLDLAIDGEGFFEIKTPAGPAYTRRGDFMLDGSGTLVTKDGYPVMGTNGPVVIKGKVSNISVSADGRVMANGVEVGRLKIVKFPKGVKPVRLSGTLFVLPPGTTPQTVNKPVLRGGYLEGSNVNVVKEMVGVVDALRTYETSQRIMISVDEATDRAINEVGEVKA